MAADNKDKDSMLHYAKIIKKGIDVSKEKIIKRCTTLN